MVPCFGTKLYVLSYKYMADPKAYRLETFQPGRRFVVVYMRTVRTQTGKRISRLGPATETKSDRSEFIVRPIRTHTGSEFVSSLLVRAEIALRPPN